MGLPKDCRFDVTPYFAVHGRCYFLLRSGCSPLFPGVHWMIIVVSRCAPDGHCNFGWSLLFPVVSCCTLDGLCYFPVCNYKDSEVSLKRGKLRQIKAKTRNPTYCPPPTCTLFPQCFLKKNQASLLLNHPYCYHHHPTTACFVSGATPFTPQTKWGLSLNLPHFDTR